MTVSSVAAVHAYLKTPKSKFGGLIVGSTQVEGEKERLLVWRKPQRKECHFTGNIAIF